MSQRYEVEIFYREPSFEVRIPKRKEPFSWTYTLPAESVQEAVDKALARFQALSEASWVSWIRCPVEVRVRLNSVGAAPVQGTWKRWPISRPKGDRTSPDEHSAGLARSLSAWVRRLRWRRVGGGRA